MKVQEHKSQLTRIQIKIIKNALLAELRERKAAGYDATSVLSVLKAVGNSNKATFTKEV